jgi:peptidoglycan/xylan/chitin deacetylase (PgdA/CDA1 family)
MSHHAPRRSPRDIVRHLVASAVAWSPVSNRVMLRLPGRGREIALTFDDGPDADHTPYLLDILARFGARATFFLVGSRAVKCPDLVRRIAAEGHSIGNHSYSHVDCTTLSVGGMMEELNATDRAIRDTGVEIPPTPFRPPWGRLTLRQSLSLLTAGRKVVYWSHNPYDFRSEADEIIRQCRTVRERDVVLLHDRNERTRQALPEFLAILVDRGVATVGLTAPARAACPAVHDARM